jgi:hypothetical protein
MPSAGESVIAGKMPGERIATQVDTADSSGFGTTETVVSTVTAALVTGRTYRVSFRSAFQSDVSADTINTRLREDNVTGTQLQARRCYSHTSSAGFGFPGDLEAEYVAVSTGNKTFVATGVRSTGTGTAIVAEGSATTPRYLYVDYIRG